VSERLGAQGAVCAGGRYDGLFAQLGGKPAPACGYAMGVERILALLGEARRAEAPPLDVYLVHDAEHASDLAWRAAEALRDAGLNVAMHCGGGSFKSQMKRADASGARFAVIVGEREAASGRLSLKPLRELGEQVVVDLAEATDLIRAHASRAS
jgi:histidyl-tRNA synthetase